MLAVDAAVRLSPRLMESAPSTDREGGYPAQAMRWLHAAGLCLAPVPVGLGGQGLNDNAQRLALLCMLKHIGRGDLVVGRLYEGHVNALQLIFAFGNPAQQEQTARDAAEGRWFGVWNTQGENGVRLTASPGGGLQLTGSKLYASGAGHIDRPLVTAQRADGSWQLVLTEGGVGIAIERSFWQPLGMRATASFQVRFDAHPVQIDALVGMPGDYLREPRFSAGAVRFAAVQLGGAEAVLDETRRALRRISRTDDPYQRMRLGEMAMAVEGGNLWFDGAARHCDSAVYAHLMRSAIEQIGLRVMQLAERCVGARGLLRPSPLERLHRDLTHYLRQAAPDAVLAAAGAHVLASDTPSHQLWGR